MNVERGTRLWYQMSFLDWSPSYSRLFKKDLCAQVFCLHVYLCTMCAWCPWWPEDIISTGTGVTDSYESTCGHQELIQPRSSATVTSALSHWAISPAPRPLFFSDKVSHWAPSTGPVWLANEPQKSARLCPIPQGWGYHAQLLKNWSSPHAAVQALSMAGPSPQPLFSHIFFEEWRGGVDLIMKPWLA